MRILLTILSLIMLSQSCAPPTSTRNFGKFVKTGDALTTSTTDGGNTSQTTSGGGDADGDGFQELEPDNQYNVCDDSYGFSLGYVSGCKGTFKPIDASYPIRVTLSEDDLVNGTCFMPMTEYAAGGQPGQRYIGNPSCLFHQADATYEGSVYLYSQEQSTNFNAMMVLKPQSLDAFYRCMDAAADFVNMNCPYFGGNDYQCQISGSPLSCISGPNQVCASLAAQTQEYECGIFTNQHDYVLLSF